MTKMMSSRFLLVPAGVLATLKLNLVDVHRISGSPKSVRTGSTGTPNSARSTFSEDIVNTNSGFVSSDDLDDNAQYFEGEQPGSTGPDADDENTTETPRNDDDQTDDKRQVVANNPKKRAQETTWKETGLNLVEQIVPTPARFLFKAARFGEKARSEIKKPLSKLQDLTKGMGKGSNRIPSTSWVVPNRTQQQVAKLMEGAGAADGHYILPPRKETDLGQIIEGVRRLNIGAQGILENSEVETTGTTSLKKVAEVGMFGKFTRPRRVRSESSDTVESTNMMTVD